MRILVFGEININRIDGSNIWLRSVCRMLGGIEGFSVDILLRNHLESPEMAPVNVRAIDPRDVWQNDWPVPYDVASDGLPPIFLPKALEVLESKAPPYDLIVVRGLAACRELVRAKVANHRLAVYLTNIPQRPMLPSEPLYQTISEIMAASQMVFSQTPEFRTFLEGTFEAARQKCVLLPPMVADEFFVEDVQNPTWQTPPPIMLYAGKIAPLWCGEMMGLASENLRWQLPEFRLEVYGDKIHVPGDDMEFKDRVLKLLNESDAVDWKGGKPQSELPQAYRSAAIGFSVRESDLDDSLEVSTKVLEYAASGLPPLLNRTPMHERLLGSDYPLFANNQAEVETVVQQVLANPQLHQLARQRAWQASQPHKMSHLRTQVKAALERQLPSTTVAEGASKPRLLVAGHDLKFLGFLQKLVFAPQVFDTAYDRWTSMRDHTPKESQQLLNDADVIFCEWCFENAVWYSHHVKPHQKLFVRFHRVEVTTDFPARVQIENVEKMVFVSEHLRQQALEKFGWPAEKTMVIPNAVDALDLDRSKTRFAPFNLGIVGILPQLKRLDRALDIIEALATEDDRYQLHVRGKLPWELPWLWRGQENRQSYERLMQRIQASPVLTKAVVFSPFGSDMARWLQQIGWILSVSDLESFHLAAAEGMASGALPLIIEREGARDVFPGEWIMGSVEEVVEKVQSSQINGEGELNSPAREAAKAFIRQHYDLSHGTHPWLALLLGKPLTQEDQPWIS